MKKSIAGSSSLTLKVLDFKKFCQKVRQGHQRLFMSKTFSRSKRPILPLLYQSTFESAFEALFLVQTILFLSLAFKSQIEFFLCVDDKMWKLPSFYYFFVRKIYESSPWILLKKVEIVWRKRWVNTFSLVSKMIL